MSIDRIALYGGINGTYKALCCLLGAEGKDFLRIELLYWCWRRDGHRNPYRGIN